MIVNPQNVRWLIPEVAPEDGTEGALVTRHWTAWLGYWLTAVPISIVCVVSAFFLFWKGALSLSTVGGWVVLGIVVVTVFKYAALGYLRLKKEVVLVTPLRIYEQKRRMLWYFNVKVYNMGEYATHEVKEEWLAWLWIDVRTLHVSMKGTTSDLLYEHAAGGEETERDVSRVLALAQ